MIGGIGNDFSLGVQKSLNDSQKRLENSQERIATGTRINSAADDAAAIALISRFASQIAGNDQGVRNISDGISAFQTAETGVDQVSEAMNRIRELGLQSLNGTLTDSDRAALQSEVSQLQEQIGQTLESTNFNGVSLLDRDGSLAIQAGGDTSDSIELNTHDVKGQLSAMGFAELDISTAAGAASALGVLDDSAEYLNEVKSEFGATQNRFEMAMSNLQTSNLNAVAAQSRIQDTDMATATAQNATALIQQQANIAMMTQASSISAQHVNQLLGLG